MEFAHEVEGWLPVLSEVVLPRLSGSLLADVVHRKRLLLVDWMVGVGGNLRCCLFLGLMVSTTRT